MSDFWLPKGWLPKNEMLRQIMERRWNDPYVTNTLKKSKYKLSLTKEAHQPYIERAYSEKEMMDKGVKR